MWGHCDVLGHFSQSGLKQILTFLSDPPSSNILSAPCRLHHLLLYVPVALAPPSVFVLVVTGLGTSHSLWAGGPVGMRSPAYFTWNSQQIPQMLVDRMNGCSHAFTSHSFL